VDKLSPKGKNLRSMTIRKGAFGQHKICGLGCYACLGNCGS